MTVPLGTGPNPNPQVLAINGKGKGTGAAAALATELDLLIQPSRVILSLSTRLQEVEVVHLIVWNHAWKFPSWPPLVLE